MSAPAIRDFAEGDLDAVLALRARAFGPKDEAQERARWAWELDANPARDPAVPRGWVAEAGGALVGFYGLLPARVAIDGRPASALCGMDLCVDPEHRSSGLGLLLSRRFAATDLCAFPFVTSATPTAAALMRYCGSDVLECKREPSLWARAAGERGAPLGAAAAALELETVERFDARFDELFARVARHHRILTWRDARYLEWRYGAYPFGAPRVRAALDPDGRLAGYCIVQRDAAARRAHLVELFCEPARAEVAERLAADAAAHCDDAGLGDAFVFTRVAPIAAALARQGFFRVAEHPLSLVCRLPAGTTMSDWYVSAGDGDVLFDVRG